MKVLDQFLHEGYHYELCKLGCDFTIVTDKQLWDTRYRPVPKNVKFVEKSGLVRQYVEKFDIAIIRNYRQFKLLSKCNIPKIIVMHCSKVGQGDPEFAAEDLRNYIIVFNSYNDRVRWNLRSGPQHVIWHGFDPDEWPISDRSVPRLMTAIRKIEERPKVCGYNIIVELEKSGIPIKIVGDNPKLSIRAPGNFDEFKRFHATYAAYLNPTFTSPMPRGRGEAMMSGLPIITTNFYDEEMFIENGVNGYRSNDVREIKEFAALVLTDKKLQAELAINARKTAEKHFHINRFLSEWNEVLEQGRSCSFGKSIAINKESIKIYITRKDSSAGGGTISSNNAIEGLREEGYSVSCLDINSKAWVAFVDDVKLPSGGGRVWDNYIVENPCDIIVFDDIERYRLCKHRLPDKCKVILCILGNPQVHPSCWTESGILDLDEADNPISYILCRPIYARYLQTLFGKERIISWIGGCNGKEMRSKYGRATYKHPNDGALIVSAHRGTDWWKNSNTALLAAFAICKKYPECIYFKPSGNDNEAQLLAQVKWDIQYGGSPKEGMNREELLYTIACAQIALEPGYSEGFSRSCNEMMNLGVPVIQGPNAEHIFGNKLLAKHLLVRDPSNTQEVVDKALALLENKDLWNIVSEECIHFSSQFNIEQETEILKGVIKNAIGD